MRFSALVASLLLAGLLTTSSVLATLGEQALTGGDSSATFANGQGAVFNLDPANAIGTQCNCTADAQEILALEKGFAQATVDDLNSMKSNRTLRIQIQLIKSVNTDTRAYVPA